MINGGVMLIGVGFVIRNSVGNVLGAGIDCIQGDSGVDNAEALRIYWCG